jgi:1-acyl-sn-glycerol-3-phosphate acyltransferase
MAELWISGNNWNIRTTQKIKWDIRLPQVLQADRSYLVCANHQSWMDIVILQYVFNRKIPFFRFFLKRELLFVPLLGLAWWALDYPFMKRFSKQYLEKYPEKRGEDLKTTQRATEKFKNSKVSILNFLEGTRFTKEKQEKQKPPFQHLLLPKAGGMAFVLQAMGEQFDSLLDVTIVYPIQVVNLWEAFQGRLPHVIVDVRKIQIPSDLLNGNYLEDPSYREKMQIWISQIWREKDLLISQILAEP